MCRDVGPNTTRLTEPFPASYKTKAQGTTDIVDDSRDHRIKLTQKVLDNRGNLSQNGNGVVVVVAVVSDPGLRYGVCMTTNAPRRCKSLRLIIHGPVPVHWPGGSTPKRSPKMLQTCSKNAQHRHTHCQPWIVMEIMSKFPCVSSANKTVNWSIS